MDMISTIEYQNNVMGDQFPSSQDYNSHNQYSTTYHDLITAEIYSSPGVNKPAFFL